MTEQFEKWLESKESEAGVKGFCEVNIRAIEIFNDLEWMFQWGAYLEFFRAQTEITIDDDGSGCVYLEDDNRGYYTESYEHHKEAQQEAIKEAFNILENEKTK